MKLAISAPRGKMGKLVTREALKRSCDFEIVGGIGLQKLRQTAAPISIPSFDLF